MTNNKGNVLIQIKTKDGKYYKIGLNNKFEFDGAFSSNDNNFKNIIKTYTVEDKKLLKEDFNYKKYIFQK